MTTAPGSGAHRETRAAGRVFAGIFLSRIFGFVARRVFAHYFGADMFADAWQAALRLPNVLRNLLGEGTLSASLIPVYAEFLQEGREEDAKRFAGAALGLLMAAAAAFTLIGVLIAPWMVRLFFWEWSPEKRALTTTLVRILFPMTGVLVVSAWALGILNSHRRFFVSYVAPVFWNLALIGTLVGCGTYLALGRHALVVALAWGAFVGSLLQLGVQVPFLRPYLGGIKISLGRGVAGVREAVHNFTPVVAARGVVNLTSWVDTILAGLLASGAVALLGYAQLLYMLPISLFGMSVADSELPELSRMRSEAEAALSRRVARALHRVSYFLIPTALAYICLGDVVISALFKTGAFGTAESLATWGILGGFSLGVSATASSRVLSSAFYALRDTRTPAKIAYLRVAVATALGIVLMFPIDHVQVGELHLGAAGLALGASVAGFLEYLLLRRALGRHLGPHGPGTGPILRMTLAATIASAVGVGLELALPGDHPILLGLETLLPFGVVYVATAALLGVPFPLRRGRPA